MSHTYSVSPYYIDAVIRAAEKLQISIDGTPNAEDLRAFVAAGERVPLQLFCQVLQNYAHNDDAIGLKLGQALEPAGFNVLGHLVMACRTVGDALRFVQQLQELVIDCADAKCVLEENHILFSWTPRCTLAIGEKPLLDLVLSSMRNFGIWVTGIDDAFSDLWFQYAAPADTVLYQQMFGTDGRYGCAQNGFSIPAAWGSRSIRSASENIQALIYRQAQSQLQTIKREEGFVCQVSERVARLLPAGNANIERVAESLNVSARSLQRRLSEQGKSFSDVLQQVRLQQANYYLTHTSMSLNEITACLGYREQSSFSSAYKSWTGQSPRALRNC